MAVRFDADGKELSRTTSLPSSTDFAVCLWVYLSVDRNNWTCIVEFSQNTSNYLYLETTADGTSLRFWGSGGMFFSDVALVSMSTSNWYWLAFTFQKADAYTATAYYATPTAGISAGVGGTIPTDTFSPTIFRIGDSVWTGEWFNGRVAAVKIWNRYMSRAELAQEIYTIRPADPTNLYGWYPCFPGSGERGRDYSGNGYNLTETGALTDESPPPAAWGSRSLFVVSQPAGVSDLSGSVSDTAALSDTATIAVSGPNVVVSPAIQIKRGVQIV